MVAWISFLTSLISQLVSIPSSTKKTDLRRAIAHDNSTNFKIINGVAAEHLFQTVNVLLRATNFCFKFPSLEATSFLQDLAHLQGLIDLDERLAHGEAHVRDGKWKLKGILRLKAALRWRGSWDLSSILAANSKMDHCMLDGLTVKLMNLLTTKRLPPSIYPKSVSSPIPTQIPKDRENSKNKLAAGLVGRSISYMCLISYLFHSLRSSRQNIIWSMAYPGHSGCFFSTTNSFYNCHYQGAFSEEGTIVTSERSSPPKGRYKKDILLHAGVHLIGKCYKTFLYS